MRTIDRIRLWWDELGYCWDKQQGEFRTFGIRPFGKRWFWLVVDDSNTAVKEEKGAS